MTKKTLTDRVNKLEDRTRDIQYIQQDIHTLRMEDIEYYF
jgi:hypothetical protein